MSQAPGTSPCSGGCGCWTANIVEGKPLCVWCEDGEPCPSGKGQPERVETKQPKLETKRPKRKPKAAGRETARPKNGGEMKQTKQCLGYNQKCDTQIPLGATSGLCSRCYARKNYADHHGKRARANGTPPQHGNGHLRAAGQANRNGNGRVTFELSEAQLNHLILELPMAAKVKLLTSLAED
jgi:hypothetical protein